MERVSFNINAELYENRYGELAIRFPGERVYRGVGIGQDASFVEDARRMILEKTHPENWHDMPAHELLYGQGWHCVSRMGFLSGDPQRPGLEFEVRLEEMGKTAQSYLRATRH